jgi:Na+-driven multidrug efflux pump
MTKNLTEGNPVSLLFGFSVPVLPGHLFLPFYNITDTIIMGKSLGVKHLQQPEVCKTAFRLI